MAKKHVTLEKQVGETPLACIEKYRSEHPSLAGVPLAYAGRLDPMASGALLVLIGDECKKQKEYHGLDKEYEFSVLFGVSSDTGDVLGRIQTSKPNSQKTNISKLIIYDKFASKEETKKEGVNTERLKDIAREMSGKDITFPYPHFSSKTVQGKPLHVWTLEGRIDEIDIPTYTARLHRLKLIKTETKTGRDIAREARAKIDTIPEVTDERKKLGADFRRVDIRKDWEQFAEEHGDEIYTIATFRCIASSGAYMRTLSEEIARRTDTTGLAWHIHRNKLGTYRNFGPLGFLKK